MCIKALHKSNGRLTGPGMGDPDSNIKQFLHAWLGTNKHGVPDYEVRPTGPKHRQRFLCEVSRMKYDSQKQSILID
jgi:hypothetical protein